MDGIDYIWKLSEREHYAFICIWLRNESIPWAEVEVRIDSMWYGIFEHEKNEELMDISIVTPKIVADIIKKIANKYSNSSNEKGIIKIKYYKNGEVDK